ncbi:MAG: hypothetical protein F4123_01770 [Gemmatimonadetes bacterium]|nr:hypothetical protein [Gemmatimonadota bacterium]MYB99616.1 hypothetical protein [Gemmatimonadota bacterium]MYI45116.1 hypothetical protein [Gemmatimonadota bacterium]
MAACTGPDAPPPTDAEADAAGAEVPDGDLPSAPAGARLYPDVALVADAVWHDGVWFVLDGRADQVHRIGPDGSWLGSFAGRGEGPGELRGNVRPIVVQGDTVVVLDDWGLHLYGLDGTPLADRRVLYDHCEVPAVVDMAPGPAGLLFVARCYERYGVAWYELDGTRIQLYDLDFQGRTAQPVFPAAGRDRRDP